MKGLLITASAGLVVALTAGAAFAKPRFTVIHMTKNFNTSLFPAECLGTVTTETLPSQKGELITWVIKNSNGHNNDDKCPSFDATKVELHFKDDVMGTAAKRVLKPGTTPSQITGTVDAGIPKGAHKYFVFYKSLQAGPDPEIEVACTDCGGSGRK